MDDLETAHFIPEHHYLIRPSLSNEAGGGMQSMLRRAKAFAVHYEMPIDLLTYTFQPGMVAIEERLRESGRLAAQIRVTNMWEILSDAVRLPPADLFPDWQRKKPLRQLQTGSEELSVMDSGLRRIKRLLPGTSTIEAVDYLREDGTRFVSDVKNSGPKSRRQIALLGPNQELLKTWQTMPDMFAWLLVRVLGRERSVIVVDSPIIANSIAKRGYISPKSALIKYFHSNHAASVDDVGFGVLSQRHVESLERADVFDANIFPSQSLADAAAELIGDSSNFWTIGNIVEPAEGAPGDDEHRFNSGVVVSRIVKEKNIDHAISAIQLANAQAEENDATVLSVFGNGSDLKRLQQQVADLGIRDQISFAGYTDSVYQEFKRASFSILPTRQEAFGLSIVESMACGCIPIVYDVPYGPGSIISHGIDGYLVTYGDVRGIAQFVEHLRTMDSAELSAMRTAARERAAEFEGPSIAAQWAKAIDAIWQCKAEHSHAVLSNHRIKLTEAYLAEPLSGPSRNGRSTIDIRFTSDSRLRKRDIEAAQVFMSFRGRNSNLRLRVPGTVLVGRRGVLRRQSTIVARFQIPLELLERVPPQIIDTFTRINDGTSVREYRIPASGIDLAGLRLPSGLEAYKTEPGNFSLRAATNHND